MGRSIADGEKCWILCIAIHACSGIIKSALNSGEKGIFMAIRQELYERIKEMAQSYGATRVILFGSAVENPESARDIDIACDGIEGWKLYELAARLEDELQTPFDVVPLSPPNRFTELVEKRGRVLL